MPTSPPAAPARAAGAEAPRLVRPAFAAAPAEGPGSLVELDATQREAVARAAGAERAVLVLGAPGTGKTTVALESVVAAVEAGTDPSDVLLLAASRRAAADLRDRLSARLRRTTSRAPVQTPAAAAFAILRWRATALHEPPPTLISGPEQDLMLADLLAGHEAGEGAPVRWPDWVTPEMRALRAFRDELRDLLMRAAERGLTPGGLERRGLEHGRPEWVAAAQVYREYLDVVGWRSGTPDVGERFDPARLVDEGAAALEAWSGELPGVERPGWRLVVVDDHQESTAATARLLRALADDGARLVLIGDPDAAVQTFRGAAPALVTRATVAGRGPGELGAGRPVVLGTSWRHGAAVRQVVARVTGRVGTLGSIDHRRARGSGGEAGVRVAILPSPAQEAAFVAHALRTAHLEDGVAWGRMAVIARSGAAVTALRRALAGAEVPVSVVGSDVALRDEPGVQPLLLATAVAVGAAELDAEAAVRLATSPFGRLDAVGLRRVRRALRAAELAAGGARTSDALLVEVLGDPARSTGLPASLARPVAHLARVLEAGRRAAAQDGADAQGVLWAVWQAAGVADEWRRTALRGGVAGDRADRDLDAVVALFRAAETFVDRMPGAGPAAFVRWVAAQDLPADTLAAAARREAVAVLTPAGAAGQEWDLVVVAGVQEGAWPDLRLRDSLLGAQRLVDVVAGRAPDAGAESWRADREAVLHDELRAFAVACSRARRRLVVTAVGNPETQPSALLDLVEPVDGEPDPRRTTAPRPADLRGLVARLRAAVETAARAGTVDRAAAGTLARLAAAGVPGAHPDEWHGLLAPSSDAPLWGPDETVPVSPSKLETVTECALRWALEAAGGTPASGVGQNLGTLVHSIAQQHPQGTREELAAALEARWKELGLRPGWQEVSERRRADEMVRRLAQYVAGHPAVAVEAGFEVAIGRARLRGSIDRVEPAADGGAVVVDLKTGTSPPSKVDTESHAQLGAYQLGVDSGGLEEVLPGATSAGARLVYLSTGVTATTRDQAPLGAEPDSWARALVEGAADAMAASVFTATANARCDRCPVRRSCPVRGEGRQVVA